MFLNVAENPVNQAISINGYRISYNKVGFGPKQAILIHGWGSSKAWWHNMAAGLAKTHTCYIPDLVGFGGSTKPTDSEAFHIEHQAATVADLIRQLGVEPTYLIGHSMGGMISVTLAHRYPELVERLATFNPVVTGRCGSMLRVGQLALTVPVVGQPLYRLGQSTTQRALATYERSFKLMLARSYHFDQPWVRAFIRRTYPDYRSLPLHSFEFALQAFTSFDLRPFMAEVRQPALVICGREDKQIPPEDSRLLAESMPNAHLEWLSPAGHSPFVEYPDQCAALLRQFAAD
jgi:pimeloyl-ACP methyl ester carboxylesterase